MHRSDATSFFLRNAALVIVLAAGAALLVSSLLYREVVTETARHSQEERARALHEGFSAFAVLHLHDARALGAATSRLAEENNDILELEVARKLGGAYRIVASTDGGEIGLSAKRSTVPSASGDITRSAGELVLATPLIQEGEPVGFVRTRTKISGESERAGRLLSMSYAVSGAMFAAILFFAVYVTRKRREEA